MLVVSALKFCIYIDYFKRFLQRSPALPGKWSNLERAYYTEDLIF